MPSLDRAMVFPSSPKIMNSSRHELFLLLNIVDPARPFFAHASWHNYCITWQRPRCSRDVCFTCLCLSLTFLRPNDEEEFANLTAAWAEQSRRPENRAKKLRGGGEGDDVDMKPLYLSLIHTQSRFLT